MPMLSEAEAKALLDECGRCAKKLYDYGAHCVVILYSEPKAGRYTMTYAREGSEYEAAGLARRYSNIHEQVCLAHEIAEAQGPPDDDEKEAWQK